MAKPLVRIPIGDGMMDAVYREQDSELERLAVAHDELIRDLDAKPSHLYTIGELRFINERMTPSELGFDRQARLHFYTEDRIERLRELSVRD